MQWAGAFSEPVTVWLPLFRTTPLGNPCIHSLESGAAAGSLSRGWRWLALAASGSFVANAATPPPAHNGGKDGLKQVGPIDETNGYPLWFKDTNNVRLELCLDPGDSNCIMGDLPNPGQPVSFPDNFPDEAFWSVADSSIDAGGGDEALLVTATEAAFGTADGLPAKGGQISFGRIRIRAAGLVDGADYTVTHPYGVEHITAEAGAVKGINTTEDIGGLVPDGTFDATLASKSAPFLKWPTGAPAGYLGDPTVEHAVTGSPFDTNYFRLEGPAGSFTGSTQLCANPALGDSPVATDDCIESDQFTVQGKIATRAGVEVTKAYYANSGTGHMMDLFAFSEPGQNLIVSGTGIAQTKMREDASTGRYYARVFADGAPPADLAVTNKTDAPNSVDHIDAAMFGDKVHIDSAVYSNDDRTLTVSAAVRRRHRHAQARRPVRGADRGQRGQHLDHSERRGPAVRRARDVEPGRRRLRGRRDHGRRGPGGPGRGHDHR